MNNDSKVIYIHEWTIRIRGPEGAGPHPVILLLHGWTGDENSMWIFAGRFPGDALLVAPRGLHKTPLGGYGWHPHQLGAWPDLSAFDPAIQALLDLMTTENFPQADFSRMRVVGFSQGAALTYAFALEHPERVASFAGLSGFMPKKADSLIIDHPLHGKRVFVAHGTQDDQQIHLATALRDPIILRIAGLQPRMRTERSRQQELPRIPDDSSLGQHATDLTRACAPRDIHECLGTKPCVREG